MLRISVLLLVVLLVGCASAPRPEALPVVLNRGQVGFGPLRIGMPLATAEATLRQTVRIEESFTEACGQGHSDVEIADHRVRIQWADEPPREIESLFVELPVAVVPRAVEQIAADLEDGVATCGTSTSPYLAGCFRETSGILVLAETDPNHPGIRFIIEDCTD